MVSFGLKWLMVSYMSEINFITFKGQNADELCPFFLQNVGEAIWCKNEIFLGNKSHSKFHSRLQRLKYNFGIVELTLKTPIKTAADNILTFLFYFFKGNKA